MYLKSFLNLCFPLQTILVMVGSTTMIVIANYWTVIIVLILAIVFAVMRKWFLSTAKSIKHVEATGRCGNNDFIYHFCFTCLLAKSPVFATLNSTLNGLSTIRANNTQEILIKQFDGHQVRKILI